MKTVVTTLIAGVLLIGPLCITPTLAASTVTATTLVADDFLGAFGGRLSKHGLRDRSLNYDVDTKVQFRNSDEEEVTFDNAALATR